MSSTTEHDQAQLAAHNSETLGARMPEVSLPDGTKVQTGTVGALLANIKVYDNLAAGEASRVKQDIESSFKIAIPLLVRVGMFDLFTPDEWMNGRGATPGRQCVGKLAEQHLAGV